MIIIYNGKENFIIKTKNSASGVNNAAKTVKIGQEISLGELKIENAGEYESGGVQLEIIDGVIEVFSEKMTIAWIKKGKIFKDEELEKLNGIDVLLIGVGGGDYTETKKAIEIINQIEPSIVIPMGEDIKDFLKEEGITGEGQEQLKLVYNDLSAEERKVVILKANF